MPNKELNEAHLVFSFLYIKCVLSELFFLHKKDEISKCYQFITVEDIRRKKTHRINSWLQFLWSNYLMRRCSNKYDLILILLQARPTSETKN